MGGLTSAVHWWEESQLRVLVLSSMAIQILLCAFAFLRKYAIPRYLRSMVWLAYLAGDAVAIYGLATFFNRHKTVDHQHLGGGSPSPSKVELIWVPILLIHLGGNEGITAYNIEDNELWSRHLLTAVFQVTVAIYVFKKSWPPIPSRDDNLITVPIMLFILGVLKCFIKPWALKRASIYSLVGLGARKRNEGEMYVLEEYVKQAKAIVVRQQNSDEAEAQRAKSHKEPGTNIKESIIETISAVLEGLLLPEGAPQGVLSVFIRGLLLPEGAPTQGSFCGRIRERLTDRVRLREERSKCHREMLQRRRDESKLFVDLSSTYPRRLSILKHFCGLGGELGKEYGSVRQGLATAFLLLYTKLKTTSIFDNDITKMNDRLHLQIIELMVQARVLLPWLSLGIFHKYQRKEASNANIIDVKITYAILYCTAVLEAISLFVWAVTTARGKKSGAWPEMVAQYSVIGYFARSKRHRSWMWVARLFQCKDFLDQHWCMKSRSKRHRSWMWVARLFQCKAFLDQHWCMKSCFSSSCKISELVLHYLKDGWKEKIHDAHSYRLFNDHSRRWVLKRNQCSIQQVRMDRTLPFDECVLVWHIATDFCFFFSSSFSGSEQISASAEVPTTTISMRITEIKKILSGGRNSSSVDSIKSQCREMSNYMVYLLFVNPEMLLPGTRRNLFTAAYEDLRHILHRDNKFAVAYKQIKGILKDKDKEQSMYKRVRNAMKELKEILSDSNRNPIGWNQWKPAPVKEKKIMKTLISTMLNKPKNKASEKESKKGSEEEPKESPRQENFIDDAWAVAQGLLELGHEQGDKQMWEMIQGVWVEMLCYSASRCRGYLHAKALGNGGEFLSYVWLLLFRMGMETFTDRLQRDDPRHDEAGNNDMDGLNREDCAERLKRKDLPSQGGNKNNGTASTSTSEICEAADDLV